MAKTDFKIELSICVYRVLLRSYPTSFRQRFGEEMVHSFADMLADQARRRPYTGVLLSWARVVREIPFSVSQQHALFLHERFMMSNPTWMKAFASGAVATFIITSVAAGLHETVIASRAESLFIATISSPPVSADLEQRE